MSTFIFVDGMGGQMDMEGEQGLPRSPGEGLGPAEKAHPSHQKQTTENNRACEP